MTLKSHFSSLFRRWRQQRQQWKQQLRLFEQFFVGDAELILRPTAAEPTAAASAARGKRSLVKTTPSFSLLNKMSCSSSAIPILPPTPSPPSPSSSVFMCCILTLTCRSYPEPQVRTTLPTSALSSVCAVLFFAVSNLSIGSSYSQLLF